MRWREAVWEAVRRQARAHGDTLGRAQLIAEELPGIVAEVGARGPTPAQTLSRVLQELRDDGVLIFHGGGRYSLASDSAGEPDLGKAVATQVARQMFVRVGQSGFRNALLERWAGRCPLTGIGESELLRASHIVAWSACRTEDERLDPDNGLLLSALWDAAFDRGLVSFEDDGSVVASPKLTPHSRALLLASGAGRIGGLTRGNRERLALHRAWCAKGEWPTP
jgi:hypothetical protein